MFEHRTSVAWPLSSSAKEGLNCLETRCNIQEEASLQVKATEPSCLGLSEPTQTKLQGRAAAQAKPRQGSAMAAMQTDGPSCYHPLLPNSTKLLKWQGKQRAGSSRAWKASHSSQSASCSRERALLLHYSLEKHFNAAEMLSAPCN